MSQSEWQLVMIAGFFFFATALMFLVRAWLLFRAWTLEVNRTDKLTLRRSILEHLAFVACLVAAGLICTHYAARTLHGL